MRRLPPRAITFQRKRANRRVINEPQLIRLLQTYGEVTLAPLSHAADMTASPGTLDQTQNGCHRSGANTAGMKFWLLLDE